MTDPIQAVLTHAGPAFSRKIARQIVISVLESVREPSDEVVAAYPPTHRIVDLGFGYSERIELLSGGPRQGWVAMIDALIAEITKEPR